MGISLLFGLGRLRPSLPLFAIFCCLAASAWAETEPRHSFDIPASLAIHSLKLVARQSGVGIVFDSRLVREVRTPAIRGSFTPLQAFQLLLKDTSLVVIQDAEIPAFTVYRGSGTEPNTSDQEESSVLKATTENQPGSEMNDNSSTSRTKKRGWLSTLAAVLTLGIAGAPPETSGQDELSVDDLDIVELEKFVVTGYRASLLRASEMKKNANQVVDAVSAEDIGKLPDPTVADALQRITGIQLTRQDNEGREVSVRGLSSFFTKVTMNGVGIAPGTAADDSDGLDVGLLPADLISSLEVFKSPTAKQVEGGVGGTVNIRTARPLELDRHSLYTGRLRMNYEPLQGSATPDASIQIARVINEDFGILFGFKGVTEVPPRCLPR